MRGRRKQQRSAVTISASCTGGRSSGGISASTDYVLAMDAVNMRYLARLCPAEHAHKLKLLMEYARGATSREVPDPYYGNAVDFEWVLDLVESASEGLLDHIRTKLDNPQNAQ